MSISQKNHFWRVLINSSKWICNFSLRKGMKKKNQTGRGVLGEVIQTPLENKEGAYQLLKLKFCYDLESKFWPPATRSLSHCRVYWTLQVVHWPIDNEMFRAILKYLIDNPYYLINVTPMFSIKLPNTIPNILLIITQLFRVIIQILGWHPSYFLSLDSLIHPLVFLFILH